MISLFAVLLTVAAQQSAPVTQPAPAENAEATAGVGAKTDQADPKPAKTAADTKICKTQSQTMTRFRKKTCRTKAEWDRISEDARRAHNEQRESSGVATSGGE